ncbi:hypothetical protein [Mesorhizobium sp. 1B3]|uniref:hypothetical protein n=1 Tax=Mesorhizobium sp. 1B3 TaxID=3243599 RepID=UPI003D963665
MRHASERPIPVIKITIPTATPAELERGVEAALSVFVQSGIHPCQAAEAVYKLEGWDVSGFDPALELTEAEDEMVSAWLQAGQSAIAAACSEWEPERQRPLNANMELIIDPETQLAERDAALSTIRAYIKATDGAGEELDDKVPQLAQIIASDIEDRFKARDLVADLTIAYTTLQMASYYPDQPAEAMRQRVLDAVNALEREAAPRQAA